MKTNFLIFGRFLFIIVFIIVLLSGDLTSFETVVLIGLFVICLDVRKGTQRSITMGQLSVRQGIRILALIRSKGDEIPPDVAEEMALLDKAIQENQRIIIADDLLYIVLLIIGAIGLLLLVFE